MVEPHSTDWAKWHSAPFPAARITRSFTKRHLCRVLHALDFSSEKDIMELGGGASCFYDRLNKEFKPEHYIAVDNCIPSLEALPENCEKICCDLLQQNDLPKADLVFSAGLIEHFSPMETASLIRLHLQQTNPNGLTVLLFPTPTKQYRFFRRIAELSGKWAFPDERPLNNDEVIKAAGFQPVYTSLIRSNIFTQSMLVFRKSRLTEEKAPDLSDLFQSQRDQTPFRDAIYH